MYLKQKLIILVTCFIILPSMASQYLTPIPQDNYQSVGLVSAVVGFFLLAYFFM